MKYLNWVRSRAGRFPVIFSAIIVYFLLLDLGGLRFFPQGGANATALASFWFLFGFSSLTALMFLTIGSLVWLFARNRRVALLLFCCSFTMMIAFVVQTGSVSNDVASGILSSVSSILTVELFAIFLMLFPRNYLPSILSRKNRHIQPAKYYLLWGYLVVMSLLCIASIMGNILYFPRLPLFALVYNFVSNFYFLFALVGIIVTMIISYRRLPTLRERQQVRLFMGGVVLAFAPFLLLTIFPLLLGLSSKFVVNGQISTLSAMLLPLALGYSILRYQILVFDMYVRRVVAWVVGAVSLIVLGYLVVTFSSLTAWSNSTAHIVVVAFALAALAPCAWWLAHVITERLFFNEIRYYRRLIEKPAMLARETFDIDEAATLLTLAIVAAFEIDEVCLYVLDQETGNYQLSPELETVNQQDDARQRLARLLFDASQMVIEGKQAHKQLALFSNVNWLPTGLPLFTNVATAKRPLLLSEAAKAVGDLPTGLARYLSTDAYVENDPLLIPVRAQGKMIGLLALGERSDGQQYAGPDYEVIDLIVSRFAPVLETARLYRQAGRHAIALNALYSGSLALEKAYKSIEEVAAAYAAVAADAIKGGAEIWLHVDKEHAIKRILHVGEGPLLIKEEQLESLREEDWQARFYIGPDLRTWQGSSSDVPACLPQTPLFPFAWLPLLTKGDQRFGMLALTYPRPHLFLEEDKRVLSMFASQCAAVMENTQMTIALRDAYEQQKELDILKDQFIMTASHELRTPLTAVQGYIELLQNYNARLNTEERAEFIAKAQRGCDELVLMVGNIMDSSRIQVDINEVSLGPVPLAASVAHVLEIMEGVTIRENRLIRLDVSGDIVVIADELRLRQIILNLVGNAVKYSPAASPLEISASVTLEESTLRIRDFGSGIPPGDQPRLFERFVRLERDMNSPVRGAGLGLYISKQLVEAMGGHMWVESSGKEGEGSVFAFSLKQYHAVQALAS
ncbi:MAG TPA: ATP-binding protein [Ktedonobacteraceae bacterium]|nr:ATP-binding protein [Ktedonobacteraceae bacterium]